MQCDFVFAYLRLSRDDKEKMEESNSIKNQRLLIQHFVENQPEFAGAKFFFFVDDGYSGTTFDRPEFKRMMGLITRRKRICIIVKDLSRLGRDTIETQNYIEKIFPFLGVRFISINDFYDSIQKPSERKDTEIKFKNLINGIYPQICSDNIKKVMRKQAEMGQYHGSIPTYGYCFHDGVHTKLHLDMEAASVVRGIFDQRLEGKTYADIARDLNKKEVETPTVYLQRKGWAPEAKKSVKFWDGNLVKLILFNPVYAGLTVRGKTETRVPSKREYRYISREDWICVKGGHEAIVTEQELQKVQDMVQKDRKYHGSTPSSENIFAGLIRCGHCGRKMRIRTEYKEKPIYCKSVTTAPNASCYPKKYKQKELEELVLIMIRQQAALAEDTIKQLKKANQTLNIPKLRYRKKQYEKKLALCKQEKMELYEQYVEEQISLKDYLARKQTYMEKIAAYQQKIQEIEAKILKGEEEKQKEKSEGLQLFVKYKGLEELSYEVLHELIEVINFYDPEHIEIVWKYRDEFLEAVE